jgi:hypothetical protein
MVAVQAAAAAGAVSVGEAAGGWVGVGPPFAAWLAVGEGGGAAGDGSGAVQAAVRPRTAAAVTARRVLMGPRYFDIPGRHLTARSG